MDSECKREKESGEHGNEVCEEQQKPAGTDSTLANSCRHALVNTKQLFLLFLDKELGGSGKEPAGETDRRSYQGQQLCEQQTLDRKSERGRGGIEGVPKLAWVCKFEKPNTSPNSLEPSTTVLSPYLKFGCLSARTFYHQLKQTMPLLCNMLNATRRTGDAHRASIQTPELTTLLLGQVA
uniref:Uncharacterized protein n=1 Tax=Timema tahoe TaxID=61484 RepID=A0A7R9P295_9NEOP|nr:unnamed protein product [Timema tahoe]